MSQELKYLKGICERFDLEEENASVKSQLRGLVRHTLAADLTTDWWIQHMAATKLAARRLTDTVYDDTSDDDWRKWVGTDGIRRMRLDSHVDSEHEPLLNEDLPAHLRRAVVAPDEPVGK